MTREQRYIKTAYRSQCSSYCHCSTFKKKCTECTQTNAVQKWNRFRFHDGKQRKHKQTFDTDKLQVYNGQLQRV